MEKLKKEFDVAIHWRSFELRPAGSPPISPDYLKRIEASRPIFAQAMKKDHAVEINPGPFGINSRPSLVVDKLAEAQGVGEAYHLAVLDAYWSRGKDISDTAVLQEIAGSVGLHSDAVAAAIADPEYIKQVDADIQQARDYGLDGVPAVVFDAKYLVMGAQPYETFAGAARKVLSA